MKNQITILLADENKETLAKLKKYLGESEDVKSVEVASSGEEALAKIREFKPDVVVMDVILPGLDGFAVLEEAKKQLLGGKFMILSSLTSAAFVQKAMSLGVEYYMVKPVANEVVLKRIIDIFSLSSEPTESASKEIAEVQSTSLKNSKSKLIEEKITNIFITVGIPAHIKGYHFLREAIKMAIDNPEVINSITKQLYPSIAERFQTSASKVERAIRHAIEVAWNRGKIENINSVFGVKVYANNEKPTNGEFIALVADKMLIEG